MSSPSVFPTDGARLDGAVFLRERLDHRRNSRSGDRTGGGVDAPVPRAGEATAVTGSDARDNFLGDDRNKLREMRVRIEGRLSSGVGLDRRIAASAFFFSSSSSSLLLWLWLWL